MNLYANLICAAMVMALAAGAYWQGRHDGAANVRVEWSEANRAASDLADAERRKAQAKAQALSKRLQDRIATQDQTNRQIADALERELTKEPFAADCTIPDGVRLNVWNAANRGESVPAGELPVAGPATTGAKVRQP